MLCTRTIILPIDGGENENAIFFGAQMSRFITDQHGIQASFDREISGPELGQVLPSLISGANHFVTHAICILSNFYLLSELMLLLLS